MSDLASMLRAITLAAALVTSCGDAERDETRSDDEPRAGLQETLAVVDGTPITAAIVDGPLRLELYDLERDRYRRRSDRLLSIITARLGPDVEVDSETWRDRVDWLLEVPPAPRLDIPDGSAEIRGLLSAPVTIVEFVDFESSHSRALQPTLTRLLDRYPDRVRVLVRDLPLPYHRYARDAARAARCAADQDRYWAYHDTLLLEQPRLSRVDLGGYASRLGLETAAFADCIDSRRHDATIASDEALAATLGVRRAGTTFVNGLYLPGRPSLEEIENVIQGELERLGLDPTPHAPQTETARVVASTSNSPPAPRAGELPEIPADWRTEPEAVLTLSRAEVDRALRDRRRLDRGLEAGSAEYGGQRLLKVRSIDAGDFYERLGLEEGDVLLVVNGEFMSVAAPALFEAFEAGDSVRLVIMRKGLPHTYEYRVR
jgi:protein-disulfide isomerase